jgi:hypothetical protein
MVTPRHIARRVAAGFLVLAALPIVVSCGSASRSATADAHANETPTVTTIDPSAIDHDSCVETLKSTIAALKATQVDLSNQSDRLNSALNALLPEACTSAPAADRATRCLSDASEAARSLTDAGTLALGYGSLALELAPTTERDQVHAMDVAVMRVRAGIEARIRDQLRNCNLPRS